MLNQEVAPLGRGGTRASPAFRPTELSERPPFNTATHEAWATQPGQMPLVTLRLPGTMPRQGA